MAFVQYCTIPVYPNQFRLTHDLSMESLSTSMEEDLDEALVSPDLMSSSPRSWTSVPVSTEPIDANKWIYDPPPRLKPQLAERQRRISESDESYVKDNFTNFNSKDRDNSADTNATIYGNSRKFRRPRKLPDIPVQPAASSERCAMTASTRSLAEELQEADPALQIFQAAPEGENPWSCGPLQEHSPAGDSGICPSLESSLENCPTLGASPVPEEVDFEFCEDAEYIDDEMRYHGRLQKGPLNLTPAVSIETLRKHAGSDENIADNKAMSEDGDKRDDNESFTCIPRSSTSSSFAYDLDDLEPTHRGCHKFMPRHTDELFIEIGDPLYVEVEADDLWCEGVNLRTGCHGIFPAPHATDLRLLEDDEDGLRLTKFKLQFLGSVEVSYHKGTDVLTQAIHKVAATRRMTLNNTPAPMCTIEVNEYGIKMIEKVKGKNKPVDSEPKPTFKTRLLRMLSKEKEDDKNGVNHFFSLKNISFCGFHPRNDKYFAFITKHPLEMRFACHVFLGMKSTRRVAEAVGTAFQRFYKQYMAFVHQTEDIYIE